MAGPPQRPGLESPSVFDGHNDLSVVYRPPDVEPVYAHLIARRTMSDLAW
jgi:hypothetical protein